MRDDSIVQEVKNLMSDLTMIKSAQPTGAGGTKVYEYESNDAWDINITATSAVSGTLESVFTSDTQPAAFVTFEVTCLIDNAPFYSYSGTDVQVYTSPLSGIQTVSDVDVAKKQSVSLITFIVNSGHSLKIKTRAVSLARGTLTLDKVIYD